MAQTTGSVASRRVTEDDDTWRILPGLVGQPGGFDNQHPRYAAFIGSSPSTAFGHSSEIAFHNSALSAGEQPTLALLQDFCASNECNVFYIHTKGVARSGKGQEEWRQSMEHFVLTRYADCLEALRDHDACGINWSDRSGWCRFFGGNFWWAKSSYIRTLPDVWQLQPRLGEDSVRFSCERWIGENPNVKAACLFNSRSDHYANQPLPRSRYAAVREVRLNAAFEVPSAWRGLENAFQDLLEPVNYIRNVIEIGVMYGFSLFCLAEALPDAAIVGIDAYDALPAGERARLQGRAHAGDLGTPEAEAWTRRHLPFFPNAQLLKMTSDEAFDRIREPIDVLHLDSIPTFEDTKREFKRWVPKIRNGGCVLFHDTKSFPEEVGRFFELLPGRKGEIKRCNGLGVWYKLG